MWPVVAICVGASAGALARWGLGLWLSPGGVIPWGTLTTFSSFSAEVVNLLMHQRYALALGTAGLHLVGSLLLTVAGIWSVQHLLSFQ